MDPIRFSFSDNTSLARNLADVWPSDASHAQREGAPRNDVDALAGEQLPDAARDPSDDSMRQHAPLVGLPLPQNSSMGRRNAQAFHSSDASGYAPSSMLAIANGVPPISISELIGFDDYELSMACRYLPWQNSPTPLIDLTPQRMMRFLPEPEGFVETYALSPHDEPNREYGTFVSERLHGLGKRVCKDAQYPYMQRKYVGMFDDGDFKGGKVDCDLWDYQGKCRGAKRHGHGANRIFARNCDVDERYVGDWVDDQRHGRGVNTSSKGEYDGEFVGDVPHGQGAFTWPDKRKYVGFWVNGRMDGQGVYTWPSGDCFVGTFFLGERQFSTSKRTTWMGHWKSID